MAAATARRGSGRRVRIARPAAASDLYAITRCVALAALHVAHRRNRDGEVRHVAPRASVDVPCHAAAASTRALARAGARPGSSVVPRRALAAAQQRGGHLRSVGRTLAPRRAGRTAPPSRWRSAQREVATERAALSTWVSSAVEARLRAEPAPRHAAVVTPRTAAAPHAHEKRRCGRQHGAKGVAPWECTASASRPAVGHGSADGEVVQSHSTERCTG